MAEPNWPSKEIVCAHQSVNPKQLCLICDAYNIAIDDCVEAYHAFKKHDELAEVLEDLINHSIQNEYWLNNARRALIRHRGG